MAKNKNDATIQAARRSFGAYCAFVHKTDQPEVDEGQATPQEHHSIMGRALTEDNRHVLLLLPRGASKTSIVAWFIEWKLGRASLEGGDWAKRFRVVWLSHKATEANGVSLAIKNTIVGADNDNYKACFPAVKPYMLKWSDGEWRVMGNETERHPTFKCGGIESPPLGARADIIVCDDIADKENMATGNAAAEIQETLDITVKPMLKPGTGRWIFPMTRWRDGDPADWAEAQGFKKIHILALTEVPQENSFQDHDVVSNGVRYRSFWPERFPVEGLLEERNRNPRAFARTMQNEVAPSEGVRFKREYFEPRFTWLPEAWITLDSWDTALGKGKDRSFSAGLSATITQPGWHVYITHMYHDQVPYPYLVEAVRTSAKKNKPAYIIVENKSSGIAIAQEALPGGLLQEYGAQEYSKGIMQAWAPAGENGAKFTKEEAVDLALVMCVGGRVHLPSDEFCLRDGGDLMWSLDFDKEIFGFDGEPPDDIVDAFVQLLCFVETLRRNTEYHKRVVPRMSFAGGQGRLRARV